MIAKATNEQRQEIISMLQAENLPVEDLPVVLDNFFVAMEGGKLVGAIGLELYGNYGLLRSMVVGKAHRNRNIASQLLQVLEQYAKDKGSNAIYLLTETASQYFERKNYRQVSREDVPNELQGSSEFSHVCPVTAVVMKKAIQISN